MCAILWCRGSAIVLDVHQDEKWHLLVRVTGCTELSEAVNSSSFGSDTVGEPWICYLTSQTTDGGTLQSLGTIKEGEKEFKCMQNNTACRCHVSVHI